MTQPIAQATRTLFAAALLLALAACGPSVRGTYESQGLLKGMVSFDFIDGDTMRINNNGIVMEAAYKVEGRDIKFTVNGQTQILTLDKDSCFEFGPLGRFCKA